MVRFWVEMVSKQPKWRHRRCAVAPSPLPAGVQMVEGWCANGAVAAIELRLSNNPQGLASESFLGGGVGGWRKKGAFTQWFHLALGLRNSYGYGSIAGTQGSTVWKIQPVPRPQSVWGPCLPLLSLTGNRCCGRSPHGHTILNCAAFALQSRDCSTTTAQQQRNYTAHSTSQPGGSLF